MTPSPPKQTEGHRVQGTKVQAFAETEVPEDVRAELRENT